MTDRQHNLAVDERHFVGAALACAHAGDFEALDFVFSKMPEAEAVAIGRRVADKLEAHGNLTLWAEALHRLPRPGWREAGQHVAERLGAWAAPPAPANDDARRLRALACRLLRAGTTGRDLLRQLDNANATLARPVSAEQVGRIAVWAANTVKECPRAA